MKYILCLMIIGITSCHSNNQKVKDDKSSMEVGVQNVNGNIPDTTHGINLSTQKKDTMTRTDSLKK